MSDTIYTFYKQHGNNILYKYRKNGRTFSKKIDFYKPSLYIKDQSGEIESIFGYRLKHKQFDCINDAKKFIENMSQVGNVTIEGNSNFANQFVIELHKGEMPIFDKDKIRACFLDIEVDADTFPEPSEARWPINGITMYDNFTDTYYCYGDKPYIHDVKDELLHGINVVYQLCNDELDLLTKMLNHFQEFEYDLTTGWNSEMFDMPYIVNRCYKVVGKHQTVSSLSPFGNINIREVVSDYGKTQMTVDIVGLPHIDYMALYKKHNFTPRESFRLDFIANAELSTGKLSYEDEGTLSNLYATNPQHFYRYNIRDVQLVKMLDDKLGFLNITYTLAYYTLSNYEDTLGTVKLWEQLIAKHLYNTGRVPLFKKEKQEGKEFDGAFVHPTKVGKHEWVVSVDLNSLYPMNEIQYNIGPETLIPVDELPDELKRIKANHTLDDLIAGTVDLSALKRHDVCMSGSFSFYRKDKVSFMAEIKDELYSGRKIEKKQMLAAQTNVEILKEEAKKRGLIK